MSDPTNHEPGAIAHVSAFVEDALSELDAISSRDDLAEDQALEEEPAFLDDEGPSAEIPTFINRTNARELFGLRPGETVSEAIARHNAEQA
jgi:hypothetical protein